MTMIINEKMSNLVTTLVEKTEEGKVSWSPTVNADEFVAGFSRYAILIRKDILLDESPSQTYFELLFLNENGREMESSVSISGERGVQQRLRKLFTLARRSAYNVEEGLNRLLQEIESI